MRKERLDIIDIDPTTTQIVQVADMFNYTGCSVQVVWTGLTASSAVDVELQLSVSNRSGAYDDIAPFYWQIDSAADSVTFEHNAFESDELWLKVTSTDCTGGSLKVYTIKRID